MMDYMLGKHSFNSWRKLLLLLALYGTFLLASYFGPHSTAHAQCYRLTDDRGTIHFTDTIYRWINDKGEVYYTNYSVFLSSEKYLAVVKDIEPRPPPEKIKEP